MQKSDLTAILTAIFSQWQHVSITEEMVNLWHDCFKNIEKNSFYAAVRAVLLTKTDNFPPTISEVQNLINRGSRSDSALDEGELWGMLLGAVGRFGSYRENECLTHFDAVSPRLAAAIRAIGWRSICMSETSTHAVLRSQFWKVVRAADERNAYEVAISHVPKSNALPVAPLVKSLAHSMGAIASK